MPTDPRGQLRDYVVKQDVEIHFKGETTFDNGLTVGVRVELEGQTSAAIRSMPSMPTSTRNGASCGSATRSRRSRRSATPCRAPRTSSAPTARSSISPMPACSVMRAPTAPATASTANPPRWCISARPLADSISPSPSRLTIRKIPGIPPTAPALDLSNNFGQNSENISVGATYEREFNGFGFVIGGGGSFSLDREYPDFFTVHSDNRQELNAYAQFRYAGFTLGGAYSYRDTIVEDFAPGDDRDAEVFGAGATYAWSRYAVGMGWTRGRYENGGIAGSDQYDVYALTGSYVLGPGITIDGLVGYSDYEGARPILRCAGLSSRRGWRGYLGPFLGRSGGPAALPSFRPD